MAGGRRKQLGLFGRAPGSGESRALEGWPVSVAYGGGVNTVALLVLLADRGVVPRAIVMADPGSERTGTLRYRDDVMAPWLASRGFPPVVTVSRIEEGKHRPRAWRLETLRDECMRMGALPSVAYGWKKCSGKYKAEPQRWWHVRQQWALEAWWSGAKIVKAIGYDADEPARVGRSFQSAWEQRRFVAWHPLFDAGIGRDECVEMIASAGLPVPPKSACTFCPNNTLEEWMDLRRDEPDAFADAVEMSRNAAGAIENPDVVGLMRCSPRGKRQLHVWADGGYGCDVDREVENALPCECST